MSRENIDLTGAFGPADLESKVVVPFRKPSDDDGPIGDPRRFFGCPWWWFEEVFPVVQSKAELAVALQLYRLRVMRHSLTVVASNSSDLFRLTGVGRWVKSRTLKRLAAAGLIEVRPRGAGRSPEVTFLASPHDRKKRR
jgi:hypothetical protein